MKYPLDLNGKPTTKEQWDRYAIEKKNHEAMQDYKQGFADGIFSSIAAIGIEATKEKVKREIDMCRSMDAPNPPGYYRANND